jgi:hypothetical protein
MRPLSLTKWPPPAKGSQYKSTAGIRGSVRCQAEMADLELAEDFPPIYDVLHVVATVADADREAAFAALLDVDLLKLGRGPAIEFARSPSLERAHNAGRINLIGAPGAR